MTRAMTTPTNRFVNMANNSRAESTTTEESLTWQQLVARIKELFSSEDVDTDEVKEAMAAYHTDQRDWEAIATFDAHRYTRNLVDEGNGRYNLLVLCWGEGHASPIHDHADSHCFMKMLSGSLKETVYQWPKDHGPMSAVQSTTYRPDDVTYINDSHGLHRVENPSHTDTAVSLHLYSPPIVCCKSFDQRSGRAQCCTVTFHSRHDKQ